MVTGSAACVELAGGDVGDAAGFSAGLFPLEQPPGQTAASRMLPGMQERVSCATLLSRIFG